MKYKNGKGDVYEVIDENEMMKSLDYYGIKNGAEFLLDPVDDDHGKK